MMPLRATHAKLALSALGLAVLTGCASVSLDQNINRVNDEAGSFTGGKLALARTLDERDQRAQAAQALLAQPLEQKDAVQLALVNSPSLQPCWRRVGRSRPMPRRRADCQPHLQF
jgi:hypothetical protein